MKSITINKKLYTDSQLYSDVKNIKEIRANAENDSFSYNGWLTGEQGFMHTPIVRLDDSILSVIQAYYEGKTISVS